MAKLPGKFNADEHEEMGSFDAIPVGKYNVKVSGNKKKDNKARTAALKEGNDIPGSVYTVVFEVLAGEHKGRLLFTAMNLEHTSDQTVKIAEQELTSIIKACGKTIISDLDELIGCELSVDVTVEPATAQYPAKNRIKKYESIKGVARPENPAKKTTQTKPARPVKKGGPSSVF